MAYLIIDDFKIGLDLRKGPVTSPAQSLRILKNASVNAGAEIQKRAAFVKHCEAPGTVGLWGANKEFVVFKENTTAGVRAPITQYVNSFGLSGNNALTAMYAAQYWQGTYFAQFKNASANFAYHAGAPVASAASHGIDCRVFETKVYSALDSVLSFSAIGEPANWDSTAEPANGAGFVDVSTADAFGSTILGIERYFQLLAVFGMSTIQMWALDPDPKVNALSQTVSGTGLFARNAKCTYANGDVMYLAQTGIRSLKARDSSNFAITTDVGSPVDTPVRDLLRTLTQAQIDKIQCCVEPNTGAFWISMGRTIYVLSFYPSSSISAWSEYEVPFDIDYMAANDYALALRSGDDIYIYGGDYNVATYDDTLVTVRTPFLDAKDPAARKMFRAIDAAVEGEWTLKFNVNPRQPEAWSQTAIISDETYSLDTLALQAQGTHIAFELTTQTAGRAKLSSLVCHFDGKTAT